MRNISFFIFVFFKFAFHISHPININTTYTEKAQHKNTSYSFTTNSSDLSHFSILTFDITPKETNPTFLKTYITYNTPDKQYQLVSSNMGTNTLYLHTNDLHSETTYTLNIICSLNECEYTINSHYSHYVNITGDEEDVYIQFGNISYVELRYFIKENDEIIGFYSNRDSYDPYEIIAFYKDINNNSVIEKIKCKQIYHREYGMIYYLNESDTDVYKQRYINIFIYSSIYKPFMRSAVKIRLIREYKEKIMEIPNSGIIRGIFDSNINEFCYNFSNYKHKESLLVYSESYTGGIHLSLRNKESQYEIPLINNNSTLISNENLNDKDTLCISGLSNRMFTYKTKDLDMNSFSIHLFESNSNTLINEYSFKPLIDGSYYQLTIPHNNILTLSTNKLNPTNPEFNAHILKLEGNFLSKGTKCNFFTNCIITIETFSQLNDISNTININSQSIIQYTQENSLLNLNALSIYCNNIENKNCIFIIKITDSNVLEYTETIIQTNIDYFICGDIYSNLYIWQNNDDEIYKFTIEDIYSITSPEMKSLPFDLISRGNKQIYTVNTNIKDNFYFIPTRKGYNCYIFKVSNSEHEMNTLSPGILHSVILNSNNTKYIIKSKDGLIDYLNNENEELILTIQSNECLLNIEIPSLNINKNDIDLMQEKIPKDKISNNNIEINISCKEEYIQCVAFIGLINNSNGNGILLPDSQIVKFQLDNNDITKLNFYYILYNSNNNSIYNDINSFNLNIKIPHQSEIKLTFSNKIKEIYLTESKTIELRNPFYSIPHSYFKLHIEITSLSQQTQPSIIELLAYSFSETPILIPKNKHYVFKSSPFHNRLIVYNNNITLNERGKIIISSPRNEADIYCAIFKTNTIYYPSFLGRIDLDIQFAREGNLIEYSYNTNTFEYNSQYTQQCVNGCEIYVYYSYKNESGKIDEIGISIIEGDEDYYVPLERNIRNEFGKEDELEHFYMVTIDKETNSFLIVFDTELCMLEIGNDEYNIQHILTNANKTLLIKSENELSFSNKTFRIRISINKIVPQKSWYEFRIVQQLNNNPLKQHLYTLTYNDHSICSINSHNQLCYIMIHTYMHSDNHILYIYFESLNPSCEVSAYANIKEASEINDLSKVTDIEFHNLFPNKTHYDKSSTFNSHYIQITNSKISSDQIAFITITSKQNTYIKIYVSNIDHIGNTDISSSLSPLLLKLKTQNYYHPSILQNKQEKAFSAFEIKPIKHSITCEIDYQDLSTYRNITLNKGITLVRYNTYTHSYIPSFKQSDYFTPIRNDSIALIHQELFSANERIEKLILNEQKVMFIDSEHYPLFFIYEINTQIDFFDIYVKYVQMYREVEDDIKNAPPINVSVYCINETLLNERYDDLYQIIPNKYKLNSTFNFSTSDILLYRFKYDGENNNKYIYIKIAQNDATTSIYDNSEIIIQIKSPSIQKPISANRGKYYHDIYNIKNTYEQNYIINSGNYNSELIQLEISESIHSNTNNPYLKYTFYTIEPNNTLNSNSIKTYLQSTQIKHGKTIYIFNNKNKILPDILLQVKNTNKNKNDKFIIFNIKYTSFSNKANVSSLYNDTFPVYSFIPQFNVSVLNNKLDIAFKPIKTNDLRIIYPLIYELRVFKEKDYKHDKVLNTNFPYDAMKHIKPIYQKTLIQKEKHDYIRHSIMLEGKAEDFNIHLLYLLRNTHEEESYDYYSFKYDFPGRSYLFIIPIIIGVGIIVLMVLLFFIIKHKKDKQQKEDEENEEMFPHNHTEVIN